jgi:UDP-N-acetylglucosamine--N-acetylmuramyl-(pentapeptide) pyrophosphoryl-undecaprenol N-acetylglucosamine transferase
VVPALAVAGALRAEGAEVVFVGGERAEAELVPQAGYELRPISVRGLSRTNPFAAAGAGALAARATAAAARILRAERADAVLGGGGYVAGPVGLAAVSLRIPLVLTEADSHVGMANRLLAPFARRVCLAFPISGRDGDKYLVTGRPVPAPATDRAPPGSGSGSARTSAACCSSAGRSERGRSTRRRSRRSPPTRATASCTPRAPRLRRAGAAGRRPGHYAIEPYLDRFGEALLACDLCVARAGGSIFEVAAAGRPGDPRALSARDRRPPDRQRPVDGARRRGGRVADGELTAERLRRRSTR